MFLSITDPANAFPVGFTLGNVPREEGTSFILIEKDSSPSPHVLCVQVKFTSEKIGIFHKIEYDHYIIS